MSESQTKAGNQEKLKKIENFKILKIWKFSKFEIFKNLNGLSWSSGHAENSLFIVELWLTCFLHLHLFLFLFFYVVVLVSHQSSFVAEHFLSCLDSHGTISLWPEVTTFLPDYCILTRFTKLVFFHSASRLTEHTRFLLHRSVVTIHFLTLYYPSKIVLKKIVNIFLVKTISHSAVKGLCSGITILLKSKNPVNPKKMSESQTKAGNQEKI